MFPIFFYIVLWTPIAIMNVISIVLPFVFIEFHEQCDFPPELSSFSFSGFQKTFIFIFIFQLFHFSIRKIRNLRFLPTLREYDFILATLLYFANFITSSIFFYLVAISNCQIFEIRLQGVFRILSNLGIPVIIYGIRDEPLYNVIIAQPVDDDYNIEIELPIYDESIQV